MKKKTETVKVKREMQNGCKHVRKERGNAKRPLHAEIEIRKCKAPSLCCMRRKGEGRVSLFFKDLKEINQTNPGTG